MAVLTWEQIAAVCRAVFWSAPDAVIATAITMPESSRDDAAVQAGQPYATTGWGLWQITPGNSEPQFGIDNQLLDPLNNGRAAYAKWQGAGGFSPWTTYENGLETPYIGDAEAAVAVVYALPVNTVIAMVEHIRTSGNPGPGPGLTVSNWAASVRRATAAQARVNLAHQAHATAVSRLRGRFTPPAVTVPNPQDVLQKPEKI